MVKQRESGGLDTRGQKDAVPGLRDRGGTGSTIAKDMHIYIVMYGCTCCSCLGSSERTTVVEQRGVGP